MCDKSGDCTYVNRTWLEFTGRRIAQEQGKGWHENVNPFDLKKLQIIFENSILKYEKHSLECRLKNTLGQYRDFFFSIAPRYGSQNEFIGLMCICLDITARERSD